MATISPTPTFMQQYPSLTPYYTQVRMSVSNTTGYMMYLVAGLVAGIVANKVVTHIDMRTPHLSKLQRMAVEAAAVMFLLAVFQGVISSRLPHGQESTGSLLFIIMFMTVQTNLRASFAAWQTSS